MGTSGFQGTIKIVPVSNARLLAERTAISIAQWIKNPHPAKQNHTSAENRMQSVE
jgi:hypothetical protein